jgi:organic radical activating enzyme
MPAAQSDERWSCEWIEGGLAFNRRSLHTCLIVHHDTGLPFIAPYNGGDVALEPILEMREQIKVANQALDPAERYPACLGCPHLKKRRWPTSTYPFTIVGIAQYSHCNIACSYCFLQNQEPSSFAAGFKPYPLLPVLRHLIDTGALAPDAIVDWGGGEPSAYHEVDEILDLLLEHGTFHYMHTNGTILPDAIRRTPWPERVHIICSVDAGLPETYARIKRKDYLERVWDNLAQYVRLGVQVTLKYIVLPENCDRENIDAFVRRAVAIGATELLIDVDYNQPEPGPDVILGLARLKYVALRAGLLVKLGFTGANFASEQQMEARIAEAFRIEQLAGIEALIQERGYVPRPCLDASVETMLRMLEAHCAEKDAAIQRLDAKATGRARVIREQAAEIQRLTGELAAQRRELQEQTQALAQAQAGLDRCTGELAKLRSIRGLAWALRRRGVARLRGTLGSLRRFGLLES